ncbi:DUF4386 domain-containing protein [Guptibacillus hwajinpoensis]|uniref:DUF4386 domain-containing protein n=1 Tax=Guptibacillus hwajinpoensis TaxID=208199 RepID=UPI001CFE5351|nr:DUF4386 domain-containing protein [Pseudalkalibacillus hwajinpoensis]WLR61026.1 DUF4386 domain-containing protein [Pseudalkalibacillus hwajinpoensis]
MESKATTNQNMQQKAAVFSAIALLIMTFAAFFSQGYVHSSLVIEGDAATTLKNIQASQVLFRLEVLGWLLIIIMDLIASWGFYVFLKPFHPAYALFAGWLRFLYTAILATAVTNLVITNSVVQNSELGTSSRVAQQAMDSITAFEAIWSFGLIIFGLHLIAVGLVAMNTKKIPKVISILVIIAGFSYSIIHFMYNFVPQIENVIGLLELILMAPMVIGELGFGIWLLVKGRKVTMD